MEKLLYEEEEVIHEASNTKTSEEELKILFILPRQNLKNDLNRKIKALVILKLLIFLKIQEKVLKEVR